MIAVLSLVGGNRTHVTIPKDILTTTALYHSAIEVLIRTHLNQLPLLLRRTQATTYIPSHLYLSYDHTYTPYDERYCPSCLPIKIVGTSYKSKHVEILETLLRMRGVRRVRFRLPPIYLCRYVGIHAHVCIYIYIYIYLPIPIY